MKADKISCPNCGHSFDVEQALAGKIESHLKAEYQAKIQQQTEKFNQDRQKLEKERLALLKQQEDHEQFLNKELSKRIEKEREKIQQSALESFQEQINSLQQEVDKRREENKTLKQKEIDLLKRQEALKEKEEEMALDIEKQMLERQKKIEEKARFKERENFELERREYKKKLEDQQKLVDKMKQKAEQGSMELQGEVQEIALEDLLRNTYPFDKIEEVPKGVKGADSIQTVINEYQQECGTIVYESKRTKNFSSDWIAKLKQDQVTCKADIAVLVTQAFPADMDRFGQRDGIWICGFHEVKSVSLALREMLIKTHSVRLSEENKGDKMELLYSYLTSPEFVQNIKRIVENYDVMITDLNKEKRAMHKTWAQREKQIWVVQENIAALFGSIRGIAGTELETSEVLQLPEREDDE